MNEQIISGQTRIESADQLEKELGYYFKDRQLLTHALMHASWANEHGMAGLNNERLEFLGDAVLQLCVTDEIFSKYPGLREGAMSQMRSKFVSEPMLAELGRKLGIAEALLLGRGEEKNNGRDNDSIIADAFEAVLAAVYQDGGFESARRAVRWIYRDLWPSAYIQQLKQDAKTKLQEICQQRFKKTPVYFRMGETGPEHDKLFKVKLVLPDGRQFFATEKSARKAEHAAALLALVDM